MNGVRKRFPLILRPLFLVIESMQRRDFYFDLPDELIARYPAQQRDGSRLLVLQGDGRLEHRQFPDLLDYLREGDLLVFNDTRVIPARLFGAKESGGRIEILRYMEGSG